MEEKNKNENNHRHHSNKKQKHKSYFLEPKDASATNQTAPAAKPSVEVKEATNAASSTNAPQKNNNGAHKKKYKKHHPVKKENNQPAAEKVESEEAKKAAPAPTNTQKANPDQAQKNNNAKHQKNRNKKGGDRSEKNNRPDDKLSNPLIIPMPVPEKKSIFNDEFEEVPFDFGHETASVANDAQKPAESADQKDVDEAEDAKVEVIGIRFKPNSKVYYFDPQGKSFIKGTYAIVETARGLEYGEVAMSNTLVNESDTVPPIRPAIRTATNEDNEHHKANKIKEEEAFKLCNERISAHELDMKLIEAQYTFDNTKLLFYFSSAGRVDFRELVKDLATLFRTRIELRQIGIRDEAKIMGGLGICGRPLCCASFLTDFGQVSIKMAKEQNLSLNSAKISGICGRLMCCLRYEQETYEYEIKRTPPVDSYVRTENGDGVVTEINPLAGTVKVRLLASPDVPPKTYKREDLTVLRKKNNG